MALLIPFVRSNLQTHPCTRRSPAPPASLLIGAKARLPISSKPSLAKGRRWPQ